MMNMKYIITALSALIFSISGLSATGDGTSAKLHDSRSKDYRQALKLYLRGMHSRASVMFNGLSREIMSSDPEGYSILNDVMMNLDSYESRMNEYLRNNPHSVLASQLKYHHAVNLFEGQDYLSAAEVLSAVPASHIEESQLDDYLFKKAYCELETGDMDRAHLQFLDIAARPVSDYTAPSQYSIAYINYEKENYQEALDWFEKSAQDGRFAEISKYYIMECRFLLKDYRYIVKHGEKAYSRISEERKPFLARIISESFLVLGDADKAREYYDLSVNAVNENNSRADWFYSGSVLYAVKDYRGAIESFGKMGAKTDSIGQVANYHLGFSYIQTKNKVAALDAFKDASSYVYDLSIAEDAHFNWAKLAFDINNDPSVFQDYMKRYPDRAKDDRIYSYMAVAALHSRDYAAAVDAYGMIDELDDDMRNNYMKANYLRANQLISSGSYRLAVPCLKIAAYYSDKTSRFNQMTRFWMAESYYRNDQYAQARELFMELYNQSALNRQPESYLIPYNIAYCFYKEGNYDMARKWFDTYLKEQSVKFRKDALERAADCHFVSREYNAAAECYDKVLEDYFDVNDIYPYYQSAISYGLAGNSARKISQLSHVMDASPSSRFYPEALFELGRSYVVTEDDENAFECFRRLADNVKDSTFVARAYIEMGSLSRNQSQFNEALGYYKTVVEEMPMSGYAEDALAAIESIYQTRNEPQAYIQYIETIGKGETKTEDEREEMIFNSAEQVYLTEDYQKALASLYTYIENYPSGKFISKADFYIADSYRMLGKYEQACDSYEKVIVRGETSYVEQAMLYFSELSFKMEKWEDAYGGYSSLFADATLENNKLTAIKGMMRSAFKWKNWSEALKSVERVLYEPALGDDVKREASYIKAKSLMASSRRAEAIVVMEALAADVKDAYGAEAAYTLIQDSYDKGDFAAVEEKVFAFSDAGSRHAYWLAKSFIVLGDSYVDKGNLKQARATFESVRDGYKPSAADDDVIDNVRIRLTKLEEMMAEKN
jgi:tetratricopeptide (TPR) repeat protein